MKKLILLVSVFILMTGCEGDQQQPTIQELPVATSEDSIKEYSGRFITAGNAAVLKGNQFIFQVEMDSAAIALKEKLAEYHKDDSGILPVTVKGKVKDNSGIGYSQIIEIREILNIQGEKPDNTNN